MLSIERILFPTDFSDGAARAFPYAVALARWHDAELHVLNVEESGTTDGGTIPVSDATLASWLGSSAPESDGANADLQDISMVQTQLEHEAPAEGIVDYGSDHDVDLVVMGTHGRRGVKRMLLGSVTEEVVRTADCPVLTVRTDVEDAPQPSLERILVPVDFSDASKAAVRHAGEIAETSGADVHLLHVIEEVVYPSAYGVEPALTPTDEVVGRVEETLGRLARKAVGTDRVHVSATIGYAPSTVLGAVEKNDIDLVVIATHGRTGLDRMLLGSVAERVIRQSPVPVFIVKPDRKSLLSSDAQDRAAAQI